MNGISDQTLEMHFKLYEGYVKETNKFVGLGMHLRGFGRQMGGLYVTIFNWLEGPPAFAPALFAGFAAVGLVRIYLL